MPRVSRQKAKKQPLAGPFQARRYAGSNGIWRSMEEHNAAHGYHAREQFLCTFRAVDPAEGQLDKVQTRCGSICAHGQRIWTDVFEAEMFRRRGLACPRESVSTPVAFRRMVTPHLRRYTQITEQGKVF